MRSENEKAVLQKRDSMHYCTESLLRFLLAIQPLELDRFHIRKRLSGDDVKGLVMEPKQR